MGTSLSGLTPATTFDGLLKVGDNDPLTTDLKAISTGDGTDTILQLSDSALSIGGDVTITGTTDDDTANSLLIERLDGTDLFQVRNDRNIYFGSTQYIRNGYRFYGDWEAYGAWDFNNDVNIGTGTGVANTRLLVKGSGTTSATTSLLVQNSAGTDVFKVVDDNTMFYHTHKFRSAGGYLYIECEGNVDRSLKIGPAFTATSYSGHIFKTWDGTAFSEAMRITGNTDQFVGIGETTPTARLHVKGSGNDATTTALLVQNSDATELLKVTDDGVLGLGDTGAQGQINLRRSSDGVVIGTIQGTSNGLYLTNQDGSNHILFGTTSTRGVSVGGGTTSTMGARFGIKGTGTTSATTALLVQNSAGTDLLKIEDGGNIRLGGNVYASQYIFNGSATATWMRFVPSTHQIELSTNANKMVVVKSNGVGINTDTADASAVLQADSTTQGFLPPRMTDAERDAIATPAAGLMIYDTTNNQMNYWNGSTWIAF
jgi:hypothetical protein